MTYVSSNDQTFYTNLPPKTKEALDKTVQRLKTTFFNDMQRNNNYKL